MAVSEGSTKDFIKNFRQISDLIKKNYGLTKSESEALNNEHMAQATNKMLGTLLTGIGIVGAPAAAIPGTAATEVGLGIVNQGRKGESGELVEDTDELVASRLRDKNGKVTKQRRDLASAQNKIRNTGIYSPGTVAFQDSFFGNLRKGM